MYRSHGDRRLETRGHVCRAILWKTRVTTTGSPNLSRSTCVHMRIIRDVSPTKFASFSILRTTDKRNKRIDSLHATCVCVFRNRKYGRHLYMYINIFSRYSRICQSCNITFIQMYKLNFLFQMLIIKCLNLQFKNAYTLCIWMHCIVCIVLYIEKYNN